MKIKTITFHRQGSDIMDQVSITPEDMVDTPTHEYGRGEFHAEFSLPITPEIEQWIMLTLGALGTELRKYINGPLE